MTDNEYDAGLAKEFASLYKPVADEAPEVTQQRMRGVGAEQLLRAVELLKRWVDKEGNIDDHPPDHGHFTAYCCRDCSREMPGDHTAFCIHTKTAEFLEECGGE